MKTRFDIEQGKNIEATYYIEELNKQLAESNFKIAQLNSQLKNNEESFSLQLQQKEQVYASKTQRLEKRLKKYRTQLKHNDVRSVFNAPQLEMESHKNETQQKEEAYTSTIQQLEKKLQEYVAQIDLLKESTFQASIGSTLFQNQENKALPTETELDPNAPIPPPSPPAGAIAAAVLWNQRPNPKPHPQSTKKTVAVSISSPDLLKQKGLLKTAPKLNINNKPKYASTNPLFRQLEDCLNQRRAAFEDNDND